MISSGIFWLSEKARTCRISPCYPFSCRMCSIEISHVSRMLFDTCRLRCRSNSDSFRTFRLFLRSASFDRYSLSVLLVAVEVGGYLQAHRNSLIVGHERRLIVRVHSEHRAGRVAASAVGIRERDLRFPGSISAPSVDLDRSALPRPAADPQRAALWYSGFGGRRLSSWAKMSGD